MGFLLDAREEWRDKDKKPVTQPNIPLEKLFAGANTGGTSSDDVNGGAGAVELFDRVNGTKSLTMLVVAQYATLFFPKGRQIDFLFIGIKDRGNNKMVATASCKDLRVAKLEPFTVMETVAGKKVAQQTRFNCVTLDFHDNDEGFTATRT